MAVNTVTQMQNTTAVTGRRRSPAVWGHMPMAELAEDPTLGFHEFEDFVMGGLITAPTTEAALVGLGWSGFSSTASQVTFGNAIYTTSVNDAGTLVLAETTTAEATGVRRAVTPYRISAGFGPMAWECRIKLSTVATLEIGFFLGLMEDTALTVNVPLLAGSTHALADKNLAGFFRPVANTTTFNGSYKADGVTAVNSNSGVGALAADTYVKLGMTFNARGDNKLRWFIDNVEQATTKTIPDNTGTDFPADKALGTVLYMSVGSAANDNTVTVDWVEGAQMFPTIS